MESYSKCQQVPEIRDNEQVRMLTMTSLCLLQGGKCVVLVTMSRKGSKSSMTVLLSSVKETSYEGTSF